MYKKKVKHGEPFLFQEFYIFTPRQFNDKKELEAPGELNSIFEYLLGKNSVITAFLHFRKAD